MKTLALILARGGSKGIPRKNSRILAGKPLIAWSIQAALASTLIDAVIVSTEDEEIAGISRQWGAQVPFRRPMELAQDDSPSMEAILHALDQLPLFDFAPFDSILILQPTSPLRTAIDIDDCINLALSRQAPSVVSICQPTHPPFWMVQQHQDGHLTQFMEANTSNSAPNNAPNSVPKFTRRQDLPSVYALNGALYFANIAWLRKNNTFLTQETLGLVMPPEKSIDIDTPLDWKIAELLLSEPS